MSAQTSWWYCGKCGFANHPRATSDSKKCEQCGADQAEPSAVDFVPVDRRG